MSSTRAGMSSLSVPYQEGDRKLPWLSNSMHSLERPPSVLGPSQPSRHSYMEASRDSRLAPQDQTLEEVCQSLQSPPDHSLFSDVTPLEIHKTAPSTLTYTNQAQDKFHPIDNTMCYLDDTQGYHGNLLNHHANLHSTDASGTNGNFGTIESMGSHGAVVAMTTGASYGQLPSFLHRLEDRLRYKINIHLENIRAELQEELYREFELYRQSLGGVQHLEYFDKYFPRKMSLQSEHAHQVNQSIQSEHAHQVNQSIQSEHAHQVNQSIQSEHAHQVNQSIQSEHAHQVNQSIQSEHAHQVNQSIQSEHAHQVNQSIQSEHAHQVNQSIQSEHAHQVNQSIQSEHAHQVNQEAAGDMNSVNSTTTGSAAALPDQSGASDLLQCVDWRQLQVEGDVNVCLIKLLTYSAAISSSLQRKEYNIS